MKSSLIEYNGEQLSLIEIAKRANVSRWSLTEMYKTTNDIYSAIEKVREKKDNKYIEYNGEKLALTSIAKLEKLKVESLKKFYIETNDIYKAVKLANEAKENRKGTIEYNGKKMSMSAICKIHDLERHAVTKYYEKYKDIDKAIELAKESKEKQNGTIEYNGKKMTISGIANLEDIKRDSLKKYYEQYNNINKAVLIAKEAQRRRREAIYKNGKTSIDSFAKYHNLSVLKVEELLDNGNTLDSIEKDLEKENKKEFLMYNGTSLYKYCLDNGYNYWVISYMIEKYKVPVEDAVFEYKRNGQQIPHKWIYEKYGILFKHLMLKYGYDSNRIIKLINFEGYTLEEALVKLIFINDSKLSTIESNWLYDLYEFINASSPYEVFYVSEEEKEVLRKKHFFIEKVKRDLLLYELSEVIDIWSKEELFEMFTIYDITDKEIVTIYSELYQPFNNGLIDPTLEHITRIQNINLVISSSLKNDLKKDQLDKLSNEDKMYCLNKIKLIKDILEQRKEYIENNQNKVRL